MQYVQYAAEARIIAAQQQQQQPECVARDTANVRCIHRDSKKQDIKLLPVYSPNVKRIFKILSLLHSPVNLQQTRI